MNISSICIMYAICSKGKSNEFCIGTEFEVEYFIYSFIYFA